MKNKFYTTTPIYYANAQPHIGHAYTTIATDVLARFYRGQKTKTFFLTGMDEHGAKIAQKAEEENKTPQELVDEVAESFLRLWRELGIKYDNFIRTTNPEHKKAIQIALQKLYNQGIIYKGEYEGMYCVGCEQFKNESDLVDGKCPDHNKEPEVMKEESYMMKMSDKQDALIKKIENDEFKITPEKYKKEILSFLNNNKLEELSISRKNVKWGIPLPFDESHTAYVWFDALLNYLTGLGWTGDSNKLPDFWPADVQLIGKDILRVHATIWPIMLMHLGIELPKQLFTHGHILSDGKKMSKTLGNVISIDEMLEKFGTDATRYLLLSAGTFGEDIDITMERMIEKYNADLANGLGNLVSRVVTLSNNFNFKILNFNSILNDEIFNEKTTKLIEQLKFDQVLKDIWKIVQDSNKYIEETKPWELAKNNKKEFEKVMTKLTADLYFIAELLEPFMSETSEKIKQQLKTKEKIILFERIKQ
ncbi:MAG TPA: methionine--tRNA ligase [Candidatus Moranbacteria bacterium]|nr:methionine--tRNA ligase [Candidatus Moranbacteria bacterium]